MPVEVNFSLGRYENGVLTISMAPPTPIGAWSIQFTMWRRFGMPITSGLVTKSVTSGYGAGQSGITIVNSGIGIFNVSLNPPEVSGLAAGNYSYRVERLDSGSATGISQGFRSMEV